MLKKSISILLSLLILILFFSGCGKKEKASKEKESIKVVAIMPLIGDAKDFGQTSKNALDLMTKDLKKKNIEVIYFDDENNKEKVESSLKELITKEKIKVIILCTGSESGEAVAKIASESQIVVLNATVTSTTVANMGKYIYNICYTNEFEGNTLAQFTNETLKFKNAAILYNEDDIYSKELADFYKDKFEKLGGKVTTSASYKKDTLDYSEALNKIKTSPQDILFLPDYYYRISDIAKQARKLGIKTTLLGGDGWDDSKIFGISELQGSYFSSQFLASDLIPGTIEFKKIYESKYKSLPDARAALTYDAAKVLMTMFENPTQSEGADKQREILDKMSIEGVTGALSFEKERKANKMVNMVKINNGTSEIVSKIAP